MNLSCLFVFLFVVNTALGYNNYRRWNQLQQYEYPVRKIVGGTRINSDGHFPYLVSIRYNGQHFCGGSILNQRYILTAAHCAIGKENFEYLLSIQYGKAKIDPYGPNVVPVERIIVHENYELTYNDIAILQLGEDIIFGDNASPVILPYQNEVVPQTNEMTVMGWGKRHTFDKSQIHGLYTIISKFSDGYCARQEQQFNPRYQYCGGIIGGGRGQCSGDSGGPVMINGKQFGIVSWSTKPCASIGNPGVFTRVPVYRIWIYTITGV